MRRSLVRLASGIPPPAARPRAVSSWGVHSKQSKHLVAYAVLGGSALVAGYVGYINDFSVARLGYRLRESWRNMWETTPGDPAVEDLQKALGPPPPEHYINVLLAVEDVLLLREWDRRYGYTLQPREGMGELLKFLVDPNSGCFVTLWSENSTTVAQEMQEKLSLGLASASAHTPPLSMEHMFLRDGGKRKEKRLEYFNRDPSSILLIDSSALSEALNPNNTVCVQSQSAAAAAAAAEAEAGGGRALPSDLTCKAIKTLIMRIKDECAAMGGAVNVPRALHKIRADAARAGFAPDAMGLYSFLSLRAAEEAEAEHVKNNSGLGGLLRRSVAESSSGVLRRPTTMEAAARKRFTDPGAELGEDSLLTRKVRDANRKMFGGP